METVLSQEDESAVDGNDAKLEELQKELLKRANGKVEYDDIADEINRLREIKQNAFVESSQREGLKQRVAEMMEFLDEQTRIAEVYDENVSSYATESVAACVKTDVVNGRTKTSLAPQNSISRAEVAVIVERLLKKSDLI